MPPGLGDAMRDYYESEDYEKEEREKQRKRREKMQAIQRNHQREKEIFFRSKDYIDKKRGYEKNLKKVDQKFNQERLSYTNFLEKVSTRGEWEMLSFKPTEGHFSNIREMKVMIDQQNRHKCYFMNSNMYNHHYLFYRFVIYGGTFDIEKSKENNAWGLKKFNEDSYSMPNRRFLLFSIIEYIDQNIFCVELWPGDNMKGREITRSIQRLQRNFFKKLKFRPVSNLHFSVLPDVNVAICRELFNEVKYQPLFKGVAYGRLRYVEKNMKVDLGVDDIPIFEEIPLDIPPVAGVITFELQTPLCHIALLCNNRGTPNMSIRDQTKIQELMDIPYGKWVKLTVKKDSYSIEDISHGDRVPKKVVQKIVISPPNLRIKNLVDFYKIENDMSSLAERKMKMMKNVIGSKAHNLYSFHRCFVDKNTKKVGGFVIPFHHFANWRKNQQEVKTFDNPIVEKVLISIQNFKCKKVILRSSTNCEDIAGFNGAGLYESVTITTEEEGLNNRVCEAITRVYSSVFTEKALKERRYFGIDDENLSVAVLVQPLLDESQIINGVALTCNPFRDNYPAFFLNVHKQGTSVTDSKEIAEQWLMYDISFPSADEKGNIQRGLPTPELISRAKGYEEVLMSNKNLFNVYRSLSFLQKHFENDHPLDVEFLVNSNGEVTILQFRPMSQKRSEKTSNQKDQGKDSFEKYRSKKNYVANRHSILKAAKEMRREVETLKAKKFPRGKFIEEMVNILITSYGTKVRTGNKCASKFCTQYGNDRNGGFCNRCGKDGINVFSLIKKDFFQNELLVKEVFDVLIADYMFK